MAMLARAAVRIGLEVNRLPSPEPSWLDDWFLAAERGSQPRSTLWLFSQRCMRSWWSRGWPLSRPEAARLSPPSSLPSTVGLPGGMRAFPRWREQSWCTCAHETPPLGGTIRVSRPKPVSWRPLSRPKLIVLRARQPLPCTPWLSCRFTKLRHSKRCTRVVPSRGWCRSCAQWLTSLYERWKSQRGLSGRRCPPWWSRSAISGSTWQRWRTSTSPAVLSGTAADRGDPAHPAPAWRTDPLCPRGQASVCPSPWATSCVLQSCSTPGWIAPSRPVGRQSGPDAGNLKMLEFALSQEMARTAPLLPPEEGQEENPMFFFVSFPKLFPLSQRKSNFLFLRVLRSTGQQCATPCFLTLAHDPSCQQPRECGSGTQYFPTHLWPVPLGLQGVRRGCLRTHHATFCTIQPYSTLLHHHRYDDCAFGAACTASGGVAHTAQPVLLAHAHNSTRPCDLVRQATSQVQRRSRDFGGSLERPCLARGDCCPPGKGCNWAVPSSQDEAGVSQPLLHRTQERWSPTNPGSASLELGFAQEPTRTWFPELISLVTAPPWRIPLRKDLLSKGLGTIWHPADLSGLPPAVVETITQARAPSTRQTYALKWSLFANWCSSRREDPRRCTIGVVLSSLQERLERRLSPSTLKVYVAVIAAHHDARFYTLRVEPVASRVLGNR